MYFSLQDKRSKEKILEYYKNKQVGIINTIMEPYKSIIIVKDLLNKENKSKILCLTNNIELKKFERDNIHIKTLDRWNEENSSYDTIIIDDLSVYSSYSKLDFIEMVDYLYKKTKKIIIFSIEEILKNCDFLYITTQGRETHFIEPRIIISKLNLKKKIPNIITDYFEYFSKLGHNTIIYVGKDERDMFYDNLNKYLYIFDDIKVYKDVNNYEVLKLILSSGNQIIIIEEIDKIIDKLDNSNFIIYSANKEFFTYKKIVFICGRLTLLEEENEMIIVSKQDSKEIDEAKSISRFFNKIVWE